MTDASGGEPKTADRLLWALQERAKELSCLYEVEEVLKSPEVTLDEVFAGVVRAIPPGWQYPDITVARIVYEGSTFQSDGFVETEWVQSADIVVQDKVVGRIDVVYREDVPQADTGPFLQEETKLVRTIADRLGHFILHQQLRTLVHDWRDALAERGNREWRAALNLLRRTDQQVFVRLARKMANHLSWCGVPDAQSLLRQFGGLPADEERGVLGEKNQPSQRLSVDVSVDLAQRVFDLADAVLADEEILGRIQKWILEDRSSFLVRAVVTPSSTPAEIADAIRRYRHLVPEGGGLSPATHNAVRVALVRRFLSDEPSYVRIAKEYTDLDDVLELLERLVYPAGSAGRLGGKAAGVFLATRVLKAAAGEVGSPGRLKVPRTWYVAADTVHAFVRFNNLEEVYEQKYKEIDQVRLEYPNLVQLFKNSQFPPEVVAGLSVALDDLHDSPLIVRSSSILEDRLGAVFSGKYRSLFLTNQGSKSERLAALLDAIAEVYASVFSPDPIQYRTERGLRDFREEMGIMIQEVVGTRVGPYYMPAFAGVAMSHNELRWSPRIRLEDGLVRVVMGLGTRAVDRVRDDYPVLVAPGQPGLQVNATVDERVRYAPRYVDVIDLPARSVETLEVADLLRQHGHELPDVERLVSVREGDRLARRPRLLLDFETDDPVVTFEGLIADTSFVGEMGALLDTLRDRLGHPVEIEFASDGTTLHLLQCRPQSATGGGVPVRIPDTLPDQRVVFTANRYVSNGWVDDVSHIVYVDPDAYERLGTMAEMLAVGRVVSRLNAVLPKRQFILMGPGRWGSRGDIKLGVHVTYSDISNTAMLIEIARKKGRYLPDLSFGTHFFQDLVEGGIRYLPLYPDDDGVVFDESFLLESPNALAELVENAADLADTVRVIDVARASGGQVLQVLMNAEQERAVAVLGPPGQTAELEAGEWGPGPGRQDDHWRWRMRMAERIAAALDADRFGVAAMYVIGSTKNANAGPASDIDLLVHFRGDDAQRRALGVWLEGWSQCLDEVNYLRTGYRSGGLLDVHFVSDDDLASRTSYAVKIGAVTDAAHELQLKGRRPSS